MLEVIPNNGIVKTQSYIYSIFRKAENKPFLEFHWHPEELDRKTMMYKPSKIRFPHIHVTNIDHIPSGRVGLEDVVLFLITELKVEPEKTNWNSILVETSKSFELSKSWGHSPKLH